MNEKVIAILPAAGTGSRMGADKNKLLLEISGHTVLAHTLKAFESCPLVDEVILVANEQDIFSYKMLVEEEGFTKVREIVRGGETRAESVKKGVMAAEDAQIVVIHDGARALVTPKIISDVIEGSLETGAAIAAVRVVDTLKKADGLCIVETPDREAYWQAQTPQVFSRKVLVSAMETCHEAVTDDASIAENAGVLVKLIEAEYENIKLTTPFDLLVAEAVLDRRVGQKCE